MQFESPPRRLKASLFGIIAAWTRRADQNGPAAFVAVRHRVAQHAAHHRTTATAAAWTGTDPRASAHVSESLGARLNGFENRSFADLVAEAGGLQILNDGLLSGFLF